MGYAAVSGGQEAISQVEELLRLLRSGGGSPPLEVNQLKDQQRLAVDRVMGEGSLYAPTIAALALKQAEGDGFEASLLVRAYRATQVRKYYSRPVDTSRMRIIRRISAAFQDVPGGQILGPTRDYTQRLLDFSLLEDERAAVRDFLERIGRVSANEKLPSTFPKVIELLRQEGLLAEAEPDSGRLVDITRESLVFPCPRSAKLQSLARAETGAMVALAYSSIRGYGDIHPYLGELRVGHVPIYIDPSGEDSPVCAGWVLVTEAEVIAQYAEGEKGEIPRFTLGYGLCFGHNELKAIAMAILDRSTRSRAPDKAPAEDEEFVLYHTDGIESSGFVAHWKLPHFVTFQSAMDRLRKTQRLKEGSGDAGTV